MNTQHGVWLDDLTWQEASSRLAADAVVLLPVVGHRPAQVPAHLPLKTAATIARALGQKLVERLPVVMASLIEWEGDAEAGLSGQRLRERLDSLRSRGVHRLTILDLGVVPARGVDTFADVPMVRACNGAGVDDYATSCMLALDPRSVRMSLLPVGSRAQAFAGERLMAADVDAAANALSMLWKDIPR